MTTLIEFLQQPLPHGIVHALGWTLLHFCWQGALVAGLLWCVLALVAGSSAQVRYGLACAALIQATALPLVTFARLAATEPWSAVPITLPAFTLEVSADGAGEERESLRVRLAHDLDLAAPWIPAVWAVGLVVFLGRLNYGLVIAGRLKSLGTEPVSTELLAIFEALKKRLGVKGAVRLLQSAVVQVPTVIGWLRPVVLVPAGCLLGLSPMQVQALLAHELAHIRRHDYLVSVLQSVVEALLFYHPAVWWMSQQVRHERECCCDDLAVGVGGDALSYARALACLEESRTGMPGVVLSANGGVLTMRIKRLLGNRQDSVVSQAAAFLILGVVLVVAGSYIAAAARAQSHRNVVFAGVHEEPLIATELRGEIAMLPPVAPYGRVQKRVSGALAANVLMSGTDGQAQINRPGGETAGVISGVVYDPTGALVPRAQVKATSEGGSLIRGGVTDNAGNYSLMGLPPGNYAVEVHADGFAPVRRENVRVEMGRAAGVNLKLSVGSVKETLAVKSTVAVETAKAEGPVPPPPPPAPGKPARVSAGVMAGNAISQPAPVYPVEAKAAHVQGVVVLHAVISKTGDVKDLAVVSGPPELMVPSIDSVRQWKYKPYLLNGEPTAVETTININYSLGDGNKAPDAKAGSEAKESPVKAAAAAMEGNLTYKVPPVYPPMAKAAGVQGSVVLHAVISKEGDVVQLTVVSGPPMLTTSALDAVRQWKYKPYLLNGQPTAVDTTITVNYSLDAGTPDGASSAPAETIRSIEYAGLNAISLTEVQSRFNAQNVGLKLETPYDLAVVQHAAGVLNAMLVERGYPKATITPKVGQMKPSGVSIQFEVKEGKQESPASQGRAPENKGGAAVGSVTKIGGDVSSPVVIYMVQAEYSDVAKAAGFKGFVLVHLIVDAKGAPQDVRVIRGVGMGLDEKAVEAVRQYRFKPAIKDSAPVTSELNIEVNFGPTSPAVRLAPVASNGAVGATKQRDGVTAPVLIRSVEPEYTKEARMARKTGTVLVNFVVNQKGMPTQVHVLRGVDQGLDKKAVDAVRQYRFKPAMKDDKPVDRELNVEVNFQVF